MSGIPVVINAVEICQCLYIHVQRNADFINVYVVTYTTPIQVVFFHSIQSTIYISFDEGANWTTTNLSPNTINPRSFVWNPLYEQSAIAHDSVNNHLYVTQDLGQSWTKIAENVRNPSDYHW